MERRIGHHIGGNPVEGRSNRHAAVFDPSTGEVQAHVALASKTEVAAAIDDAARAQPGWAAVSPLRRARVLQRFLELIERERDPLARLLSSEHGKTVDDAHGDIQRGLEVVEFSLAAPHLLKGDFSPDVARGVDVHSMRQPLGVVAAITPFNFPAMIPLWSMGPSIASGNALVLKPSERTPSVPLRLAELFSEAGLPDGILNVVNGDKVAVDVLLTDERIRAVGFVGSTPTARYIYATGTANGKRVQAFGGAKNHLIIMPDANLDLAADALIGSGYGSAGERCMAISVAVPVGGEVAEALAGKLVERVGRLTVGPGHGVGVDYGPLVSAQARDRVHDLIQSGVDEGAQLLVDGRGLTVEGYGDGFYVGPTLFDHVTTEQRIYREEIFGPVLSIVRAATYEEALALATDHEYGNGVSIFTRDGATARDFSTRVHVGMVGVNVPIPVPVAHYSFGGWKKSSFGDLNQYGEDAFRFYTQTKTVTTRWPSGAGDMASFVMPILH